MKPAQSFPMILLATLTFGMGAAVAEPTRVTVRVLAADAKFIGESMGSAWVTLTDTRSGTVLASGPTLGKTGDTDRIMKTPRTRWGVLSTPDSAAWSAMLDIDRPVNVRATATGPLAPVQAANSVSETRWILPGRHLESGDAWLLKMPGLAVTLHEPRLAAAGPLPVRATVTMMCGCPLEPGGLWNADDYEVRAQLWRGDSKIQDVALDYAGVTSEFATTVVVPADGPYELLVFAYHPGSGNAGVDSAVVGAE